MGAGAITEAFSVLVPYKDGIITKQGALTFGLELQGLVPDTVSDLEADIYSKLFEVALASFPPGYVIDQYYVHAEGFEPDLDESDMPVIGPLVNARKAALNDRGVAKGKLVYIIEAPDPDGLNISFVRTLLHALKSVGNSELFDAAKAKLRRPSDTVLRQPEIERRYDELRDSVQQFIRNLSQFMSVKQYSRDQLYAFNKFLATGNRWYLQHMDDVECPDDYLDACLADGDITEVMLQYEPALKLDGATPVYCKIANAHAFPENLNNLWIKGRPNAVSVSGTYVLHFSMRFLSSAQKEYRFFQKDATLSRSAVKPMDLLTGAPEKEISPLLKDKLEAIQNLQEIDETSVDSYASIVVFDEDPRQLKETVRALSAVMSNRGFPIAWDNAGLPVAFKTFQSGGHHFSYRKQFSYSSTAAELSLKYAHREAQSRVKIADTVKDTAYVFETRSGVPFYFDPFSGDRNFLFGIGPTRSGKSFARQTLLAHYQKYDAHITALDIDPGGEPAAQLLGDQGSIFRGAMSGGAALNPFSVAAIAGHSKFTSHFLSLARMMLESNQAEDAREINSEEQQQIDKAIASTLRHENTALHTMHHFLTHLDKKLEQKFSRWVGEGAYSGIFDGEIDALGGFDTRYTAFNLQDFRDTDEILQPFLLELFFRTSLKYEQILPLSTPKVFDVDEAHSPLGKKEFRDYLSSKFVTWGKFNAGINLWTQSPTDVAHLERWHAIRGAITTQLYFADRTAKHEDYHAAFGLTEATVNTIRELVPKREALLVQPQKDICQVVVLQVEPEQYVANTSDAYERELRTKLMEKYGVEEGFKRAVEEITSKGRNAA